MASSTPDQDGGASSTADGEGSLINQRNFRDSRSASAQNLAGPSSSSNPTEGAFQPEQHLIDDQHSLDLFSFGEVSSHSSSQSYVSSVVNTTGYDNSHEFGAISSTLPPVFENLFGQSPPDDVGGPFSIDDVVRTGYAPWDDIDVLSVGLNVPKVLMQGSETDGGIDESDGTSSNLPDSSSSKSGKRKSKEPPVRISTNVSSGQVSAVLDRSSSPPLRQPLLQFEDGSPDYQQCSSSSDLSIAKHPPPPNPDRNTSSHSLSAASTSGYSGKKDGRGTLIDPTEIPSKVLQFIEPDPIDPNNFFDIKNVMNDENVTQKPAASSSSDLFNNEDLLNSSQREFVSLPENIGSSFIEGECQEDKINNEASSSSQPSVPFHQGEKMASSSHLTTPKNSSHVKKSSNAESTPREFPISSSSSVCKESPPSLVAVTLVEKEAQSRKKDPNLPSQELASLEQNSIDEDRGLFSEISTSMANKSGGGSSCPAQQCVSSSKMSASPSQSTAIDNSKDKCWEQEMSSPSSPIPGIGSSTNVTRTVKKKKVRNSTQQKSPKTAEVETSGSKSLAYQDLVQSQRLTDSTQGVSSSINHRLKSSSTEKLENMKSNKNNSSTLDSNSKGRTAPDSQQDASSLSSKNSIKQHFESRLEPSSSSFSSQPCPNQPEVQSGKNGSTSNISLALNTDAAGDTAVDTTAHDECQTISPGSHSSMADGVIPLMPSTTVELNPNKGQISVGGSKTSVTTKHDTATQANVGKLTGSRSHLGESMDLDQSATSFDPTVETDLSSKDILAKTASDLISMDCTPPFHNSKDNVSQNKADCKENSTSEAEMGEGNTFMDSPGLVAMEEGTSFSMGIALEQQCTLVDEGATVSRQSASGATEESSAQGKNDALDEGSDFSDSDIDIDDLLDKDLPDEYKKPSKGKKRTVDGEEKPADATGQQDGGEEGEPAPGKEPGVISFSKKTVLKKKGREPLEGLPEHWIAATHRSGMIVYIHRQSRVCTWSRPYFLGPGSVRKHRVPLASIPCLHYMRAKEEEAATAGGHQKKLCVPSSSSGDGAGGEGASTSGNSTAECAETSQPSEGQERTEEGKSAAGTTTVNGKDTAAGDDGKKGVATGKDDDPYKNKVEMRPDEALEPDELNVYARKVFEFEDVVLRRFQTWSDKRRFWKSRKAKEVVDRPQLPAVPLFDVEMPSTTGNNAVRKKECALHMKNKTPIAILHEYCQKVLRAHPKYVVEESNNAHHPFEAVVFIEGTKYGRGQALSKKTARLNAARQTLEILLPEVMASQNNDQQDGGIEFFNQISIDDPRVVDLCSKTGQMTPFSVLQDYQQRMHGQINSKLDFQVTVNKYQKLEYSMKLGPHEAKGPCKSSKVGKQLGAQQILKQLYPKITTWGGIIKLYGKGVDEINRAKREEQKKILALSKKQKNKPNEKILEKLKTEMLKLYGPQRDSDPSSTPASVAPSGIHTGQQPAEESPSQVQSQVDT